MLEELSNYLLDVNDVAATIDIELGTWAGNCYGIAKIILEHYSLPGQLCYGDWLGPVAVGSIFEAHSASPVIHHGWIELKDGRIYDPTRWVFENTDPYIYVGVNDYYDFGGNKFRGERNDTDLLDPPTENDVATTIVDHLEGPDWDFVVALLGGDTTMYRSQAFRLANFSLTKLGTHALGVYKALKKAKCGAYIPFDNATRILGE